MLIMEGLRHPTATRTWTNPIHESHKAISRHVHPNDCNRFTSISPNQLRILFHDLARHHSSTMRTILSLIIPSPVHCIRSFWSLAISNSNAFFLSRLHCRWDSLSLNSLQKFITVHSPQFSALPQNFSPVLAPIPEASNLTSSSRITRSSGYLQWYVVSL